MEKIKQQYPMIVLELKPKLAYCGHLVDMIISE